MSDQYKSRKQQGENFQKKLHELEDSNQQQENLICQLKSTNHTAQKISKLKTLSSLTSTQQTIIQQTLTHLQKL
jgi:hypothetical protein